MVCQKCNSNVPEGMKFCTSCGSKLEVNTNKKPKKKKGCCGCLFNCGCLIFVLVLIGIGGLIGALVAVPKIFEAKLANPEIVKKIQSLKIDNKILANNIKELETKIDDIKNGLETNPEAKKSLSVTFYDKDLMQYTEVQNYLKREFKAIFFGVDCSNMLIEFKNKNLILKGYAIIPKVPVKITFSFIILVEKPGLAEVKKIEIGLINEMLKGKDLKISGTFIPKIENSVKKAFLDFEKKYNLKILAMALKEQANDSGKFWLKAEYNVIKK